MRWLSFGERAGYPPARPEDLADDGRCASASPIDTQVSSKFLLPPDVSLLPCAPLSVPMADVQLMSHAGIADVQGVDDLNVPALVG